MTGAPLQFIDIESRSIAALITPTPPSASCGLFWLPGYKSDMASTKATALADFACGRFGCTLFDYSGHGRSSGAFEDGTIGTWLADACAVFTRATAGPQVVVGSSMGGYIALLLLRQLMAQAPIDAARIKAVVLIAPAWDMTEALIWQAFSPAQKSRLLADGVIPRPSDYGEPYNITRALIEEGRAHLIGGQPFDPGRPVHIIQGLCDTSVPPAHTRRLLELLEGPRVFLEEIPDGDHRLSRPQDIATLLTIVARLADAP